MRIVVGVSGASGIPYTLDLLEALNAAGAEIHLVATAGGLEVLRAETGASPSALYDKAHVVYDPHDLGAAIASGSFLTHGMVVVPASQGTLSKIAYGLTDNLLTRAAFVHLKEQRPLILVPRETPLPLPALRAMTLAAEAGATILPASPGFYHRPQRIDDLIRFITQRILDRLGIELEWARRWPGPQGPSRSK